MLVLSVWGYRAQTRVLEMWCKLWGVQWISIDLNDSVMTQTALNNNNPATAPLLPLLSKPVIHMCVIGLPGSGKGKLVNWIQRACKGIEYVSRDTLLHDAYWKAEDAAIDDELFVRLAASE